MARPASPVLQGPARVLALICFLTGLSGLGAVVLPYSATSPVGYFGILGAVMIGVGAALVVGGAHLRPWHLHGALGMVTCAVTAGVALSTTPSGVVMTAITYLWIAAFSATHHTPRVLARHLVAIGVGLAVALWYADPISPVQTWLLVAGTYGAVAAVLNRTVQALRRDAGTDALTGVLNRRAFTTAAELEMHRARRTGRALSLAIIDLDHFKAINDTRGHAAGDAVLVELTTAWQDALPPDTSLGRLGGDEFAVLLPRTTIDEARTTLTGLSAEACGWSAGVAAWDGLTVTALLKAADEDLYAVKVARS